MATSLTDFLLDLAQDPKKADAFRANPNQVMADAGLSEEDQELLRKGDPQALKAAIDTDKLGGEYLTIIFVTIVHE